MNARSKNCHEFLPILLLSICFGLVGLDRFIIMPLFPVIESDLGLDYGDIGLVSSVLALTWGIASIFSGRLADRVGMKAVLVPAALAFSVLVGSTGLAAGLLSLVLVRALMGLAEGAFVPASIVAAIAVSKPSRAGLAVGLLHMAAALFGLGLGPILATHLLSVLPSWRWVFPLVAVPGLAMAYLLRRFLRTAPPRAAAVSPGGFGPVVGCPGVVAAAVAMSGWQAGLTILAALLPNYLTDHLRLGLDSMGIVLAGLGVGGTTGLLVLPALSDRFGYKPVALAAAALELVALGLFSRAGAEVGTLFALLMAVGITGAGVTAITAGPLAGGVVASELAASATGLVVGCGEILGGAVAPALAGFAAAQWGIRIVPVLAFGAIAAGLLALALGSREPSRLGRASAASPPDL